MLTGNNITVGTTLILIATNAFDSYRSATGGVLDRSTGLLTITSAQYSSLKTLTFNIGGVCIQLWTFCEQLLIGLSFQPDLIRFDPQCSNLAS